ncbi:MAG: pantoate--beta-alanine ligase [Verrucomicrobia bacterium]|nr:pantoate--beta-alanine ligase [Verrucomicrobiota bacterium]
MRKIVSIEQMQRLARGWHRAGRRIGFVPTMGYLHEGHLSLVREARRRVGRDGVVVVSIYVNPTQFAPHEDLAKYPRDLPRDQRLCRVAGTDVLFLPDDEAMYPGRSEGRYSTFVVEETLSRSMEGASRPTHFRGVTTVVAKLFNIVQPDVAVFGAKDFQQVAVVSRMVADLNFPVRIVVAPTVREPDGLAMSSRNKYLTAAERPQATILWQAIQSAQAAVAQRPDGVPAAQLKRRLAALIATQPAARLDYVEIFDPATLRPVKRAGRGSHLALAVFIGRTRLIDNAAL